MLDNSPADYFSEYINQTIPLDSSNQLELKNGSIQKIEILLKNLKKAREINLLMQNSAISRIKESQQKMSKIQSLLEKVNSIKKSKPKKHMKYPNYIPLESFYFYTPKKTHLYYHLLERVFESSKKDSEKDENFSEQKIKMNRYNFNKQHDNSLNNIIFLNEKDNIINWYKVSAEMNNIFNNNINRNNLNNNIINGNNNYLIEDKITEKENENDDIILIKDSDEEEDEKIINTNINNIKNKDNKDNKDNKEIKKS